MWTFSANKHMDGWIYRMVPFSMTLSDP